MHRHKAIMSACIPHELTAINNVQCDQTLVYIHSPLLTFAQNKYACLTAHVYPTACLLLATYRPNVIAHKSKKQL